MYCFYVVWLVIEFLSSSEMAFLTYLPFSLSFSPFLVFTRCGITYLGLVYYCQCSCSYSKSLGAYYCGCFAIWTAAIIYLVCISMILLTLCSLVLHSIVWLFCVRVQWVPKYTVRSWYLFFVLQALQMCFYSVFLTSYFWQYPHDILRMPWFNSLISSKFLFWAVRYICTIFL